MSRIAFLLLVLVAGYATVGYAAELECNRPHEHYACGSACQTTCRNYGEICPIVNIRCNDACYCDDGYARDSNGHCIPISKCPPKIKGSSDEWP